MKEICFDDYIGKLVRVKLRNMNSDVVGELEGWTSYWVQVQDGEPKFIPWAGIAWIEPELS